MAQFRDQRSGGIVKTVNRTRNGALVKSGFFDGRTGENAAVAAGNQVNLGRANDVAEQAFAGSFEAEHLAFNGPNRKRVRAKLTRPSARAIHHRTGIEYVVCSHDSAGASTRCNHDRSYLSFHENHAGSNCRLVRRVYQSARIDGAFRKISCGESIGPDTGLQMIDSRWQRMFLRDSRMAPLFVWRKQQDRAGVTQVDTHSRPLFNVRRELRVHVRAGAGELLQRRRRLHQAIDQHAARGAGSLMPWPAAFDDRDRRAPPAQLEGERQSNDAAAHDDDVRTFHPVILGKRAAGRHFRPANAETPSIPRSIDSPGGLRKQSKEALTITFFSFGGPMSDDVSQEHSNAGKWTLVVIAVIFAGVVGYAHIATQSQIKKLSQDLATSQAQVADLQKKMQTSDAQEETLASQLGMTKKDLATRAAQLQAQQKAAEARLEQEQKEQISAVNGEVAGVKSDVGAVKSDVASTQTDLAATKAKLDSTIGDLGVQSGLIAHTRDDLEVLKHKGDRNYYEFTLLKGAKPQPVGTVSLQLKKADAKRGKFTMNVTSDDKTIEKKDRTISEPIQFYSGRDHMLFELVVWTVDKNKATGYLSTPKASPAPVTAN